jgi:putative transposase
VFRLVQELAADPDTDIDVAVACRVLGVARSGFYEWLERQASPSVRAVADRALAASVLEIHEASRGCYGAPRVHAELRLGRDVRCGRKRVARPMRAAGLAGVSHRYKGGRKPLPAPRDDLVRRRFVADGRTGCGAPT